ncbi:prepilin-type N-terminal cleavage/methylation domain-containing protein [Crocosphaera sp. UHCC 0190]|uniref:prepilin-type N-terminal cleavage/methylation domain-containing protein n=1 Tax=Crocosphaera sp. UHCC 0190 TaxID=3110246 RepID=UPI002B2129DA|nr:prepilin-type N-terminal cleavage/methylation domain-containing protein [Crocosphaera sp. UHCC 0190]MEA5508633.1 prepilin-type N-terminal cleavage/methylation domain-containing protein [Crocosphaera sp. UHCC 0190]
MNKLLFHLIIRQVKPQKNQGFSLLEVLVAILVSSAFLMGTLQAMTINTVMQVKAERQAQAGFWIQEDLEKVQAEASEMTFDLTNPNEKGKCRMLTPNGSFGDQLIKTLNTELENDDEDDASNPDSYSVNVASFKRYDTDDKGNHQFDANGNASFVAVKDSKKTTTNKAATMQVVRSGDTADLDDPNNLVSRPYRLVRVTTLDSATKYNVLQIYYRVGEPYDPNNPQHKDEDGDQLADDARGRTSIIAENYAEIIPAAVAKCNT